MKLHTSTIFMEYLWRLLLCIPALAIFNSPILVFIKFTFQKRNIFGYQLRCPLFYFPKEKPLDFIVLPNNGMPMKSLSTSGLLINLFGSEMSRLLNKYDIFR